MVQIGKNVKYDDYGRVTIPSSLAELLDLEKGLDEISWQIINGEVVLRKVTRIYRNNFDFEREEIKERLLSYESKYIDDPRDDEELSYEELEAKAHEEYLRDKEARAALKNSRKK